MVACSNEERSEKWQMDDLVMEVRTPLWASVISKARRWSQEARVSVKLELRMAQTWLIAVELSRSMMTDGLGSGCVRSFIVWRSRGMQKEMGDCPRL